MEYYLQTNDWFIIGAVVCITLALCTYIYYSMLDREDAPVSKEELSYVALTICIAMGVSGSLMYGLMYMRITSLYPPVDGVDLGEAPF